MAAAIINLYRKFSSMRKEELERNKAMQEAMIAILRDRIYQSCNYHLTNGYISTTDLEILTPMFTSYEKLGGNGVVKKLKARVDTLKIIVEEAH